MNEYSASLLLSLLSLPVFAVEGWNGIKNKDLHLFLFFTILTNVFTWMYFLIKFMYCASVHDRVPSCLLCNR